uniref:Uncharacterized LOC105919100 n=1 Tax=Fundulus heteroclitus TaxID=8078 RepID=A0A3Q2Q1U8_FUNHE
MELNISLLDLLHLSIGTPHRGSVNFGALHALLLAMLNQLDIREVKTRWRGSAPGDGTPDAPLGVSVEAQRDASGSDRLVQPGSPLQKLSDSVPAPDGAGGLWSRIQICEDGMSEAVKRVEELQKNTDVLKEATEELQQLQQKAAAQQLQTLADVEQCCHRVDKLEEAVNSLQENTQTYPGPEQPSRRVTRDVVQVVLKDGKPQKEVVTAAVSPRPLLVQPAGPPLPSESADPPTAPRTPSISGEEAAAVTDASSDGSEGRLSGRTSGRTSGPAPGGAAELAQEPGATSGPTPPGVASSVTPGSLPQTSGDLPRTSAPTSPHEIQNQEDPRPGRYQETVEAARSIGKLQERFSRLEARLAVLEERKMDRSEPGRPRQPSASTAPQDASSRLSQQLQQHAALIDGLMSDRHKNLELVYDVQRAILQLQAECERLQETTRSLHEDNRQKQGHIEELYKTAEQLQEKKADKQMVESEMKAEKSALESKASRLQLDLATEQLTSMFHELLSKVTGQEQDWNQVIDKLSTEMERKLNRIELDSVKTQLEERWRSIQKKLQAQRAPEQEDAAGIRKQLVERFHCLSCDRPILKQTPAPLWVTLPSFPAFPPQRSFRPWNLEQIRHHYHSLVPGSSCWTAVCGQRRAQLQKSHADMCRQIESIEMERRLRQNPAGVQHERLSEVAPRGCGGNHTNTSSGQRHSSTQHTRLVSQTEEGHLMQEAAIVGLDGRIYKGRFDVQLRSADTKLPTIAARDGRMKDRTKGPQRPAVSPEVGPNAPAPPQPLGAKGAQSSRSASSGSGRDWPVSALGCCTSQSSVSPAADSAAEPGSCEPLDL